MLRSLVLRMLCRNVANVYMLMGSENAPKDEKEGTERVHWSTVQADGVVHWSSWTASLLAR